MASGRNLGAFVAAFVASIRDATGITTTVAAAGTPVVVAGALFVERRNSLPEGLSWNPTTGELTVTSKAAAGNYDVEVFVGDAIGTNAGAKIFQVFKTPAGGAAALVGAIARETEPATAVRGSVGPVVAAGVALALGDKLTVRADAAANGNTVQTRDLTFKVEKVG